MKRNYLFLIALVANSVLFAQQITQSPSRINYEEINKCAQREALLKMQLEDPLRYQEYLQTVQTGPVDAHHHSNNNIEKSGTVYTIPLVFHVLHVNGTENISDAQIEDAVAILNEDFRKLNSDVSSVVASFLPIAADAEIEFALAKIAPNGNCFDGITRTHTTLTNNGSNGQNQVNAVIAGNDVYQGVWSHAKYLNIYVCNDLIAGAAGYTYAPNGGSVANSSNMYYNGIFMLHDYTGSIGTSSAYHSRALTHEVGHWLNLLHTWGTGSLPSCGDDFVADTPPTEGSSTCNLAKTSCGGTLDNVENFMDYSYCSKMYTAGQVARMRAAITGSTGGRNNIWTTTNLQDVGVLTNSSSICSADFQGTHTTVCEGGTTTFSIINTSISISSYSWTFTGGAPATSTAASPTVTYPNSGTYPVTVTINSGFGNKTITKTTYITVKPTPSPPTVIVSDGCSSSDLMATGSNLLWSTGQTTPAINVTTSGTYTVTQTVAGCTSSASSVVASPVTPPPTAPTVTVSNECGSSNLTATGSNLLWSTGETTPTINVTTSGTYTVTQTVAACTSSATSVVASPVIPPVAPTVTASNECGSSNLTATGSNLLWSTGETTPTINVTTSGTYTVTQTVAGCTGSPASIVASPIPIPPAPTASVIDTCGGSTLTATGSNLLWSTGETTSSINVSSAGTYTVSEIVGGCPSSPTSIVADPDPLPVVTIGNVNSLCINHNPITLSASPSGGNYVGIGLSGNVFDPTVAGVGTWNITYFYTDVNGCSNSASTSIVVDACAEIDEIDGNHLFVFPNPTTGNTIISSTVDISDINLIDNTGRSVLNLKEVNSKELKLDLSHFSSGSYMIQVNTNDFVKMVKLIIE